jgi:integrase
VKETRGRSIPEFGYTYLRGRRWWIRYTHQGRDLRESAKSADERVAWRLLKDRHTKIARKRFAGAHEDKVTVGDLLDGLEADYAEKQRRSIKTLKSRVAPLREAFADVPALHLIGSDLIQRFVKDQLAEGYEPATVNRMLAAMRRAYRIATRARRLSDAPEIELLPEDNVREGFVEPATFERLVIALPAQYQDFSRFGYLTAWRKREIQTLAWSVIVWENERAVRLVLRGRYSKNKTPRPIGISRELADLLARRWAAREYQRPDGTTAVSPFVFHRDGRPIGDFRKAWASACIEVGLYRTHDDDGQPIELDDEGKPMPVPTLIFHDLRRSALRNMEKAGVSQSVQMKLSGHKTASVYRRYLIVDEDDTRKALEAAEGYVKTQVRTSNVVPLTRAADRES